MKYFLLIFSIITTFSVNAQIKTKNLYNTWVVSKVTYKDGSALSDDNLLKYAYIKYSFESSDKLQTSISYSDKGTEGTFDMQNNSLMFKSVEGYTMNFEQIDKLTDTLVLIQAGDNGFNDPQALKYYFVPERLYQDGLPLKSSDILSVNNGDTTYIESPKIYAAYRGEVFQHDIYKGISINMEGRSAHLLATFIVLKQGIADSLKILNSVDEQFDKQFIKVFNQTRKDWRPATIHGKPVNVQMHVELRYSTSAETIPAYFNTQKGNDAYRNNKYDIAQYFYDEALKTVPTDKENLFKRGICKMHLGNSRGACEDWQKAKALGISSTIDANINTMLEKYCK